MIAHSPQVYLVHFTTFLRSCAKDPSIKIVVISSSMAAVAFNGKPLAPDVLIDETWFSNAALCEKSKVHICSNFLLHALFYKFFSECYIWQFLWLCNGLSVTLFSLQLSFFFIFAFLFPLDGFSPILYYGCSLLEWVYSCSAFISHIYIKYCEIENTIAIGIYDALKCSDSS